MGNQSLGRNTGRFWAEIKISPSQPSQREGASTFVKITDFICKIFFDAKHVEYQLNYFQLSDEFQKEIYL
jgi:hypothetical protein